MPREAPKEFRFDRVFDHTVTQEEIFQQSCLPLVMNVLNGYTGTYFVYGQTGTGKTHTMGVLRSITSNSQGIIP
jgi:Cdc6-like AAA superfamily ATPase